MLLSINLLIYWALVILNVGRAKEEKEKMKNIFYTLIITLLISLVPLSKASALRFATFNIQNLGVTKMSRQEDMERIVDIIRSYDVIAIQEISDSHQTVGNRLIDMVNRSNTNRSYHYSISLSPRTGQQDNDASKAEQYAFVYNDRLLEVIESHLYDDSMHDYFGREPWIARFRLRNTSTTFALVNIHTVPTETLEEINSLDYVVQSIQRTEPNVIVLGDMNAACEYAHPQEVHSTRLFDESRYTSIIPDSADTNLARSQCAFDRVILTNPMRRYIPRTRNNWGVVTDVPRTVSDHYPVWFNLNL